MAYVPHTHILHFSLVAIWETHHVTLFTHVVGHILNLSKHHLSVVHMIKVADLWFSLESLYEK